MHRRLLLPLAALIVAATSARAADLHLSIHQVLPNQGELLVVLFDRADGFPDGASAAQPSRRVKPGSDRVGVSFTGLPPGPWAVMVLQDLNGNGRMDTNLLGMPQEPYGASNNKLPRLAAPRFDDARIDLPEQGASIRIDLHRP